MKKLFLLFVLLGLMVECFAVDYNNRQKFYDQQKEHAWKTQRGYKTLNACMDYHKQFNSPCSYELCIYEICKREKQTQAHPTYPKYPNVKSRIIWTCFNCMSA